jgi:hypothetical protein
MADITLKLDEDAALVLFDLIGRWDYDEEPFELRDEGEKIAMWKLMGTLESNVVGMFSADYAELVSRAKARLRGDDGAV